MVPMETYVREHHTQLRRRLESVKRIHRASDTVETRLTELETMRNQLQTQQAEYLSYQTHLEDLLNLDFAEDDQNIEIAEVIELKTNNRMH